MYLHFSRLSSINCLDLLKKIWNQKKLFWQRRFPIRFDLSIVGPKSDSPTLNVFPLPVTFQLQVSISRKYSPTQKHTSVIFTMYYTRTCNISPNLTDEREFLLVFKPEARYFSAEISFDFISAVPSFIEFVLLYVHGISNSVYKCMRDAMRWTCTLYVVCMYSWVKQDGGAFLFLNSIRRHIQSMSQGKEM